MLQGKKIILGVCGSIAAYKSAHLTRLLIKAGAEVQVILTSAAHEFITPLTLATVSKKPALTSFSASANGEWNNHVELGIWADIILIAPATANTMAKLANGLCDNLLAATYLSARCPVIFAPAMDLDMYQHPATLAAIDRLKTYGNQIIEAENGELASGLIGPGRMAEPEHIIDALKQHFTKSAELSNKQILITAGPTQEALDPVRYLSNHSTGRMGVEIAKAAADRGAGVTLVLGPSDIDVNHPNINVQRVVSASEMFEACKLVFETQNIAIFTAAVSDYAPNKVETQKLKKKGDTFSLELKKSVDIAKELGKQNQPNNFWSASH